MDSEPSETAAGAWSAVARWEELPDDGGGLTVSVAGRHLAVFRDGEGVRVLDDACPHMGASLGMGVVVDGDVTCPWHGWHFRLTDGRNTDGLEACVRSWPARRTAAGAIEVDLGRPGAAGAAGDSC